MSIQAINVRNQFKGKVKEIIRGDVVSEVDVETAWGIVTSVITTRSIDELQLKVGSDVVVITAGAKQQPGQSRMDLAGATITLMDKVLPPLIEAAPDAIFILVTNPVDVVTYAAIKKSGMSPEQMFGSGTVLDSSRLRHEIAREVNVAVGNVHAYIAGEHGDSEVALWSSASIGGVPLLEWVDENDVVVMTDAVRQRIHHDVVQSAYTIIEGNGATNYAIGAAGARIVEAVLGDQHRVLPVSTLTNFPGVGEVCMSLPAIVGRNGIVQQVDVRLSPGEHAALATSARSIKETATKFGVS